MARVVRQYFLPSATEDQARGALVTYLTISGFRILTASSDGVTRQFRAPEVTLPSNPGQAILNISSTRGDLIGLNTGYGPQAAGWPFIAILRAAPQVQGGVTGALVTGEFFFATMAGVNSLGVKEWTPSPSMWGVGGLIRAKAWPLIQAFDSDFGSGRVLPPPPPSSGPVAAALPTVSEVQAAAARPIPPLPDAQGMAAQIRRTSTIQTMDMVVQAATMLHMFMAFILLVVLIPISGLVLYEGVLSGFTPWLFDVSLVGIVGGTVLLAYSVYVALYRVRRPLARGETEGIPRRTLLLGVAGVGLGGVLGYVLNPVALIFAIAGVLYLVAFLRLRKLDAPNRALT